MARRYYIKSVDHKGFVINVYRENKQDVFEFDGVDHDTFDDAKNSAELKRTGKIIMRCCMCDCFLGMKDGDGNYGVSHGFCNKCLGIYKEENGIQ